MKWLCLVSKKYKEKNYKKKNILLIFSCTIKKSNIIKISNKFIYF